MRLITFSAALAVWLLTMCQIHAQETTLETLEASKEAIINEEKDLLKGEVENINKRLENNQITEAEAEQLKNAAAEKHALNIENRIAIVDNKIALIQRNNTVEVIDDDDRTVLSFGLGGKDKDGFIYLGRKYKERKYDRRTTSDFVLAFGLNNAIGDRQSLNDSDFKIGGSRFAEIGWAWKTRVFNESNWLRVKYGISFQFNGLKPTDNRYFVDTGDMSELQTFDGDLDKSKFRMDNLVIPVHFEFGPSNKIEKETYFRYNTYNKIKVGLGGYVGLNLGARQKLKFDEEGESVKQKLKANYNTNNVIYGLSGYIGWRDTALYVKYDLNPIFKDNTIDLHNVSLGLRFDMD
ncbi:MAG TPA: hypothetical protein DCS66_15725 [Flavobacteriaceae bacterium]|nr:hypothetical protein [Flavobacteriaceae bacterium]HAT66020.1 hypothetical protein [Flavobacteriaceae bacterium]|tara:strand:- start:22550 stop:23599 length:1050 start_codon:yes stop_codon:yes gene_type:complete